MSWFRKDCPKPAVCRECRVHFEQFDEGNEQYLDDLCYTHRLPHLLVMRRAAAVRLWAAQNWEKLEKQMLEEQAKALVEEDRRMSEAAERHAPYRNAEMANQQNQMAGRYGAGQVDAAMAVLRGGFYP